MSFPVPPHESGKLVDWIKDYLTPSKNKPTYRAHQFTINGVTYPFVRDLNFAAVPDPPASRRHDMYAGIYITRPGDLILFFQSDPQWDKQDIESRRGIRGIYRIISAPFRDIAPVQHPRTKFIIRGSCPNCGTFHSTFSSKCFKKPLGCEKPYPSAMIPSDNKDPYFEPVLASRLELEPLIVFERAISDERAYADMSDPGMVWIGRHDNAMGKGKGSSIRQLLPEEVVKLTRLMVAEPEQRIVFPQKANYPNPKLPMTNKDGTPATDLKIHFHSKTKRHELWNEDSLNFHIARVFDDAGSSFVKTLSRAINEPKWSNLEYASSMFPWGYTASTADFVMAFRNEKGRKKIVILEFKKGPVEDTAMLQVSLYVPWVVQVLTQYAETTTDELSVFPVAIGIGLKGTVVTPKKYQYAANFNSGAKVSVSVESPKFFRYETNGVYGQGPMYYTKDLNYFDESSKLKSIAWTPPKGCARTDVEQNWLLNTSWKQARTDAGI